jgi:thioredoxin-related protein
MFLVTFLLQLLLTLLPGAPGTPAEAFRPLDFDGALKAARVEDRPILVVFQSAGSDDSKKLDATTWKDPKVKSRLASKLVAVKLDVELEPELAAKFRIHILPTILLLTRQGVELDRITGYVDARTFESEADAILAGSDPVERVKKRLKGHEEDPHLRIDLAGALCDRGDLDKSLVEYMWCWDHGAEKDPTFAAVRRTFLLEQIQRLARLHPAAEDALAQRATAIQAHVVDCTASDEAVADFLAIEHALVRDDVVLAAYDALSSEDAASDAAACARTKERLAPVAVDAMIDARRYDDALAMMGDLDARVSAIIAAANADLEHFEKEKWKIATDNRRARLRSDLGRVFEALVGSKHYDEGDALAQRIIALDASGPMYVALIRGALRAAAQGSARSVAVRALGDKHLSDAEKLEVKSIAREILIPK